MVERQQIHIGVHREKYARVKQAKARYEQETGEPITWGDFLLVLCGLSAAVEAPETAHMEQEQPSARELETFIRGEIGWPEPITLDAIGEIIKHNTDRVIEEIRKSR